MNKVVSQRMMTGDVGDILISNALQDIQFGRKRIGAYWTEKSSAGRRHGIILVGLRSIAECMTPGKVCVSFVDDFSKWPQKTVMETQSTIAEALATGRGIPILIQLQITGFLCRNMTLVLETGGIPRTPVIVVTKALLALTCRRCWASNIPLKQCSGCEFTSYCSVACQKDDWKQHKSECGKSPN